MTKLRFRAPLLALLLTAAPGAVSAAPGDGPLLSVDDVTVVEHYGTPITISIPVRLDTEAPPEGVTAWFELSDCTAVAGEDYNWRFSPVISFAPGESERLVEVQLPTDDVYEGVETFHLRITDTFGAVADNVSSEVRIVEPNAGPKPVKGDFDGDGTADIWAAYEIDGDAPRRKVVVWGVSGSAASALCVGDEEEGTGEWRPLDVMDLDGDGLSDTVWWHPTGEFAFAESLTGLPPCAALTSPGLPIVEPEGPPAVERFVGAGHFLDEDSPDLLTWNPTTGALHFRTVTPGGGLAAPVHLKTNPDLNWHALGAGDFDGDGWTDVLWRHAVSGYHVVWNFVDRIHVDGGYLDPVAPGPAGFVKVGVADYDGDGQYDILFQDPSTQELYLSFLRDRHEVCSRSLAPSRLDRIEPRELAGAPWEIIAPQ